jgi:hypothetical protein
LAATNVPFPPRAVSARPEGKGGPGKCADGPRVRKERPFRTEMAS